MDEIKNAYDEWLRSIRWAYVATGTWEQPITGALAMRTVRGWLAMQPEVYAAVGVQHGPHSETHHVHLLIGGVSPLAATRLRNSWVRRGHLLLEPYRAARGGVRYVVEQAYDIEIIGTPERFKPRRRR